MKYRLWNYPVVVAVKFTPISVACPLVASRDLPALKTFLRALYSPMIVSAIRVRHIMRDPCISQMIETLALDSPHALLVKPEEHSKHLLQARSDRKYEYIGGFVARTDFSPYIL